MNKIRISLAVIFFLLGWAGVCILDDSTLFTIIGPAAVTGISWILASLLLTKVDKADPHFFDAWED